MIYIMVHISHDHKDVKIVQGSKADMEHLVSQAGDKDVIYHSAVPNAADPRRWTVGKNGCSIIIKGEVVVPQEREVTIRYELP